MIENESPEGQPSEQEPIAHEQPEAAPDQGNDTPELNEVEKVASKVGWSKTGRLTAEEYIERGPEVVRTLKEARERDKRDYEQRFDNLRRMGETALLNQKQQLWQQWEAAKDNAVATGDMDRYRQLQQGQHQAIKHFDEQAAPVLRPPQQQEEAELPKEVADFATRNADWYLKDKAMSGFAIGALDDVDQQFPQLPLENKLKIVEERTREAFPARFKSNGQQAQPQGSGVEGGLRPIRTNRGKGFNELPPEAKQAASRFVEQKAFKDVHEYAKEYWKQES